MAKPAKTAVNNTHKGRRAFGNPVEDPKLNQRFIPIPSRFIKPAGDLTLKLENVLPAEQINSIKKAGKMVFHMVGDTGGINGTEVQDALADLMEQQVTGDPESDKAAFFYHIGDVVYYNGMSKDYEPQFYEPYKYYQPYIFAIPGNHDCDTSTKPGDEVDMEPSLDGFMENFCDPTPQFPHSSSYRKTMNQPWPYWVLDTPFATFIGLFSNVDGSLDKKKETDQYDWLVGQLKAADKKKCLIVAVHHPCYSLDSAHGGYPLILAAIDNASKAAKRQPDAVFSGHVHNYQRFTRTIGNKKILYAIAGAGGYAHNSKSMHRMQKDANGNYINIKKPFQTTLKDVVLNYYNQANPGFLKITIDDQYILGEYYTINFDDTPPPSIPDDTFKFDWKNNKVIATE